MVGAGAHGSIALWSALGGAIASLGPLVAGWLLEHFWWGSVFLVTLPLAVVALVLAWVFVPAHVNEATEPVDNLGGILSVVLVASLVLAINFAPVPNKGTLVLGLAVIAVAAGVAFFLRQRRASEPAVRPRRSPAGGSSGWPPCAGIIVFGSLMAAMFVGQQFLQNVLGYSTLDAGLAILPAVVGMVLVAPRSAKLVETRGARFTLLVGYVFCLLGFLTMLLLWKEDSGLLAGGPGLPADRDRGRVRRHPRVALADRVGAGDPRGHGIRHGGPAARPGRRDHAVDLRGAAHRRLRLGRRGRHRGLAEQGRDHATTCRPS